ncbi:hypothetical protein LEMLEM_LOCUS12679 [Lemmus lemmus]
MEVMTSTRMNKREERDHETKTEKMKCTGHVSAKRWPFVLIMEH